MCAEKGVSIDIVGKVVEGEGAELIIEANPMISAHASGICYTL